MPGTAASTPLASLLALVAMVGAALQSTTVAIVSDRVGNGTQSRVDGSSDGFGSDGPNCFKNIIYIIAWPNLTDLLKCLGGRKGPSLHISTYCLRNIVGISFFLKEQQ